MSNESVPDHFKYVNYGDLQMMLRTFEDVSTQTAGALERRGIKRYPTRHCTSIQYPGSDLVIGSRIEVVGHLPALAEIVARTINDGRTFFHSVGWAAVNCSTQDVIVHGHDVNFVEGGFGFNQYSWGKANPPRLHDFACGMRDACLELHAEYPGGETASLPFIVNPQSYIGDTPVLFSNAHGSTDVTGLIIGDAMEAGLVILGTQSTGPQVNGISGIMDLPGFPGILLDRLSDDTLFGEAVMKPMGCYWKLVSILKGAGVRIKAMMAGSGGGVGKLAFDKRDFTYQIEHWPEPLPVFKKIMDIIKLKRDVPRPAYSFLKQFNAGVGWFVFVHPQDEELAIRVSKPTRTRLMRLGMVEEGKRGTRFEPDSAAWLEFVPPQERWLDPQEF